MPKHAPEAPASNSWEDRRILPRKITQARAVMANANGEDACDCMVQDVNAAGAMISLSKALPIGTEIYLLNTGNQHAYLAKVMWSKSDRCGLSFLQTHTMGSALPPHLNFLWRLYLEAKLREIERDLARGMPASLAFLNAGLSEVDIHYISQRANGDKQFERVLTHAKSLLSASTAQSKP